MLDSGTLPTASAPASRPGAACRRRRSALAGVAALAVLATTACGSADAGDQPEPPATGGTLRIVLRALPNHLDPQKIIAATDANLSRLITRTLTTFRSEPGRNASEIVGDLATDTGRPSEGNRVWDFTLKPGVRWEDGTGVTCQQVKYGVERSFSDIFSTGAKYARTYLERIPEDYKGPFVGNNNDGKGLESVECLDQQNIRFRLRQPVGDFGYTVAMSVFAPVPPGADADKQAYDRKPMATGPYRVAESDEEKVLLVRNPHWNRDTDQVRRAYPDQILVTANNDTAVLTNALIKDEGEYRSTIMLDADVASNFVQQVINDGELMKRTAMGPMGAVRYFAINTETIPQVECRQALAYGFNKRKYRAAMGGSMFGDLATSMIPPTLRSYKEFDHYGTRTNQDGQPDRAIQVLEDARAAGIDCPEKIRLVYPDASTIRRFVTTIVESYQRIGIEVELVGLDPANYWGPVSDRQYGYDMTYVGWVPDWANGSAVIPPLFDGRNVLPPGREGSTNFSFFSDPEIDQLIDEALAETRLETQYLMWGELDSRLQEMAVTIPVLYQNAIRLSGSNVRGAFIHPQFGMPDAASIGVADPQL